MRLQFSSRHLPDITSGRKRCTIRTWPANWHSRIRPGQRVDLAFGRRDRPVVVPAIIERVEVLDLAADVDLWAAIRDMPDDEAEDALADMEALEQGDRAMTDGEADSALELISRCYGSDDAEEVAAAYADLLDDLVDTGRTAAIVIWWRLARET